VDELARLRAQGFLARLSPERADDLISSAPVVHYPAGSVTSPGRDAPWAAVVVSGVVRQYLLTGEGRQVTIRYVNSGDLVGSPTAGLGLVSSEIEAVEPSTLLHLDAARIERRARLDSQLSMALVEELTNHLQHAYRVLAGTTFATVRSRVALDLLERAGRTAVPGAHIPVTQQGLADATGSVREVVARALRQLRLQGVIETSQLGIAILDIDALIREAGQSI
jgi:CRP/FNR family transcriptional regulator, cyclic AMP receptor protein